MSIFKKDLDEFSKLYNFNKLGKLFFLIGLIFLPSAIPISIIFLLLALIISLSRNINKFFLDKINILLIIISGLMILSNFRSFFYSSSNLNLQPNSIVWLDLLNWIPLFLSFWGFQSYIKSEKDRILLAKIFLISTFPVIASCIMQFWLGIYGPFSTLNGLIIWFQREPAYSSVTGLFNNPNYAGFWLSTMWPFSAFIFLHKKNNLIIFSYFALITYFLLLTNSRNSLIGMLISIPILFGTKILIITLLLLSLFLVCFFGFSNFFEMDKELLSNLIPTRLIDKLMNSSFSKNINFIRIENFKIALNLIKNRPILGWGATTFPLMYLASGGSQDSQHVHNINLEIAYNYGIPVSILLTSLVTIIILRSFKLIFIDKTHNSSINKAWFASTVVVGIYNFTDVTYYDGKLSLISWILLAGLKSMLDESKKRIS